MTARRTVDPRRVWFTIRRVWAQLKLAGFPVPHHRVRSAVRSAILSGKTTHVWRKSRRIGASSLVFPAVAIAVAIELGPLVPLGQIGIIAGLSVKREEAGNRGRNLAAALDALRIKYTKSGDTIELEGLPVAFKVMTANFRTAVGELCLMVWADEVSRWRDDQNGENPASEVIASIKPALATIPGSHLFLVSSPLTNSDYHAQCFDRGETDGQTVAFLAPSWELNPELTEEGCRALADTERELDREWRGIPQDSATSPAFGAEIVKPCFRDDVDFLARGTWGPNVLCIDASAGGACEFACYAAQVWTPPPGTGQVPAEWLDTGVNRDLAGHEVNPDHYERLPEPREVSLLGPMRRQIFARQDRGLAIPLAPAIPSGPHLVIVASYSEGPGWNARLPLAHVVHNCCTLRSGIRLAFGDAYMGPALVEDFAAYGVTLHQFNWSLSSKAHSVQYLRHLMSERRLWIPSHMAQLKDQLLKYEEIITPGGNLKYSGRRRGLDDHSSAIVSLGMAGAENMIPTRRSGPSRTFRSLNERQARTYSEE